MYRYELKVINNNKVLYDTVWADNSREAIEDGYDKYPYASLVEIA